MKLSRSPLAPQEFPQMSHISGVTLKTGKTGEYYSGRNNLLFGAFTKGTTVAGTLTRSTTAAAPVLWCREHLGYGYARGLVVNAGNANVFSGSREYEVVQNTVIQAAGLLGCSPREIFVGSTGIIGRPLSPYAIADCLPIVFEQPTTCSWEEAATSIMTTDTFPKGSTTTTVIEDTPITINGIVKGSGMIAPNMATMLAFIFTDAKLSPQTLQTFTSESVEKTFHCITVEGDTSTSDTVLVFATGHASHSLIQDPYDPRLQNFRRALYDVMLCLAQQVVRDGEGAEKYITITVKGASDSRSARCIGLCIANSPLVKTAIAGADPNWGRVVMAVGKSGEWVERDRLSLSMGGIPILEHGQPLPNYDPYLVRQHLAGRFITIEVHLHLGEGEETVWTCDLTHRYIDINTQYST